jgi:hypothetical protein
MVTTPCLFVENWQLCVKCRAKRLASAPLDERPFRMVDFF